MTYQVLARKWRPRSFKEMAGQSHVLKTLINSLDNNRLHHAYLFTGTRGVGKTTIARILARCLNCEEGVSSEPCGQCSACLEIDDGRFIDLIEVDAASRTKVEDTRELLDNVQYAPSRGRFKVYLIDEVHMLSAHSFNALLKTLEEPPPHVKFLLATTDPQKLPITVLSRCLQFSLKELSPEQLMKHLQFILEQEQIGFEEQALWQLGRAAKGSVRDAMTLLDQAISFSDESISEKEVSAFLGTIDQKIIYQLVDGLIAKDAKSLLDVIEQSADHAPDFGAVLEELMSYLHRIAIAQVISSGIDNSQGDKASVIAHAQAMPAENVQLYYQMALKGREDLPLSVDLRSGIEMTLLRMLAFTPQGVPNKPRNKLPDEAPAQNQGFEPDDNNQLKKKSVVTVATEKDFARDSDASSSALLAKEESRSVSSGLENNASLEKRRESDKLVSTKVGEKKPADFNPHSEHGGDIEFSILEPSQWIQLFYSLNLSGITRNIAANCVLKQAGADSINLVMAASHSAVYNEEHKKRIQAALAEYFGCSLKLEIEIGEIATETPASFRDRKERERMQLARNTFTNDSKVKEIVERFAGIIQVDTIEPLTPEEY